jgi:hypothetical protein
VETLQIIVAQLIDEDGNDQLGLLRVENRGEKRA